MSAIVCMRCSSVWRADTSNSETFIAFESVSKSLEIYVRLSLWTAEISSARLSMTSARSGTKCWISEFSSSEGGCGLMRRKSVVVSVQSDLKVRSVYPAFIGIDLLIMAFLQMY